MGKVVKLQEQEAISVPDVVAEYLSAIRHLAKTTQKKCRVDLMPFSAWCTEQDIYLHQLNHSVITDFVEHLRVTHKPQKLNETELSTYTTSGYVSVIKRFLNWCLEHEDYQEQLSPSTIHKIKKPQIIEKIIETFSPEQIDALFKACDKEESEHLRLRDKVILSVLIDTGIRAEELCTLTIGNVSLDPEDSYVRVFGKGSRWREVGLGAKSRLFIQKYLRLFRMPTIEQGMSENKDDFTSKQWKQKLDQIANPLHLLMNRYGRQLSPSGLEQMVERLGNWTGCVEDIRCSPHTFRHYFAVNFMKNNNNDIYRLSKLLGHSSVKVTENYLKSFRQSEARKGAKSVLDNLHT